MSTRDMGAESALDVLARDLQRLRLESGAPSFTVIAAKVAEVRRARGVPEHQCKPARSTVYDAFREGRRRIDTALMLDIVASLVEDEVEREAWAQRCRRAVAGIAEAPAIPAEVEDSVTPEDLPGDDLDAAPDLMPTWSRMVVLATVCVLINLVGRVLVDTLGISLYLDMTGTAIGAVLLGPWWGASIGLATNGLGVFTSGPVSMAFATVNIAGGLLWGYGVRRWQAARSIPRFFAFNLIVGLACSLIAIPTLIALGAASGGPVDGIIEILEQATGSIVAAVSISNLFTSFADKTISGFVALVAMVSVPAVWTTLDRQRGGLLG